MDPRLLRYYNIELQHLREMGSEFARDFPKVAGRLGLEGFECADPYVERLLEGFAFLAARVHLKLDDEFPRFTQHLLEMVYPHYLCPTPSMAVVQFQPDLTEGALAEGFRLERDTVLNTPLGKGQRTPCEFRTAHAVTLWPLELQAASYLTGGFGEISGGRVRGVKAGIRLRLRATAGTTFSQLGLDSLPLFLKGGGATPMHLYEQLLGNAVAVVVAPGGGGGEGRHLLSKAKVRRVGFAEAEALLPYGPRSFHGYRLLHEYFTFPERFLFVELTGLGETLRDCQTDVADVTILLNQSHPHLENLVDASQFGLFCAPVINLFPRRADRIHLSSREVEYHVVTDRTRPEDFEVYDITGVTGHGTSADERQEFWPFYAYRDATGGEEHRAYYAVRRSQRTPTSKQRRAGKGGYAGGEVFLSLVDGDEAPYSTQLRQFSVGVRCTNRDLPLYVAVGQGRTDFTLRTGAPVSSVRCLAGPTKPSNPYAQGQSAWQLISHLSLNYLSLTNGDEDQGADALRGLLSLYGGDEGTGKRKQVDGVRSVTSRPILRRLPIDGPITFGRGLEIELTLDEAAFGGSGAFLMAAVLEQFFAKYVSLNSFTETVVRTQERGEIIRWPARIGSRQML